MWIFTTEGFISAVQKSGQTDLTVRSRDRRSLQTLAEASGTEIASTPMADYPYRVVVPREQFTSWLTTRAQELDYSNFKSAVFTHRGHEFAHALSRVWSDMHEVTDCE